MLVVAPVTSLVAEKSKLCGSLHAFVGVKSIAPSQTGNEKKPSYVTSSTVRHRWRKQKIPPFSSLPPSFALLLCARNDTTTPLHYLPFPVQFRPPSLRRLQCARVFPHLSPPPHFPLAFLPAAEYP